MNNSYGNIVYSGQIGEAPQLQGQVEQHPHQLNNHHHYQQQQQYYHQETHNGVKEGYSQERESIIANNTHAQGAAEYQEPEEQVKSTVVAAASVMESTDEVKNHTGEEEMDENHLEEEHLDPEEPENEESKAENEDQTDVAAKENDTKVEDENGDAKEAEVEGKDKLDEQDAEEDDKKEVKSESKVDDDDKPLKTRRRDGEPADLDICRVCTSKDTLSDIFEFDNDMRICDIIIKLCPAVRITERDHLPHKICKGCVEKVKIAHEFKTTCENTDKELRKTLKRSYNKSRRTTDFVIVNCPMTDGEDDDDEPQDDDEYKVSQSEVESEPVTSDDSFEPSKKIKKTPKRRGRRSKVESSGAGSEEVVVKRKRGRQPGYSPKTGMITTPKRGPGRPPGRPGRPPKSASKSPGLANVVYIEAPDGSSSDSDDDKPIRPRKTHDCNKCDETFNTGVELKEHLLTHKGDLFPCTKCDKTFKSKVYLSNHLERHEQDDKKREEKMKAKLAKKEAKRQAELTKRPYHRHSSGGSAEKKKKLEPSPANSGRDLFKCVAPLTSTYWSDSFSD